MEGGKIKKMDIMGEIKWNLVPNLCFILLISFLFQLYLGCCSNHFVLFETEFVNKVNDNAEFMRQMALETVCHLPKDALQLYTDDSKSNHGLSGSGVYIKALSLHLELKLEI